MTAKRMFDVYCDGRWMTYEWAFTADEAIAKAREGFGSDNCHWSVS